MENRKLVTRKIEEQTHLDGVVVGKRRIYVYSTDTNKETELDSLLIDILSKYGPLTRGELVELTKIPRSTMYDNLARLISLERVIKESVPRSTRGRPKVVFRLP